MALCGACGRKLKLLSASNSRVWIDPTPGKNGKIVAATCDPKESNGETWPAINITTLTSNRGEGIPVFGRSMDGTCGRTRIGINYSDSPLETIDLEMERFCGGISAAQYQKCPFDIIIEHVCCCGRTGVADIVAADIIRGVSTDSFSIPVAYSQRSDLGRPTLVFTAAPIRSVEFVAPLKFTKLFTTGTDFSDVKFLEPRGRCNKDCKCGQCWVAMTETGTLWAGDVFGNVFDPRTPVAGSSTFVDMYCANGRVYIQRDAVISSYPLEPCRQPPPRAEWEILETPYVFVRELCPYGNGMLAYGLVNPNTGTPLQFTVIYIGVDGEIFELDDLFTTAGGLNTIQKYEDQVVAFYDDQILKTKGLLARHTDVLFDQGWTTVPPPPNPFGAAMASGGVRVKDEFWVFINRELWCTDNCGDSWSKSPVIFDDPIVKFEWVTEGIGYIATSSSIYRTITSGKIWSKISGVPDGIIRDFDVSKCNPNCILLSVQGNDLDGNVYIGKPSC